MVTGTTDTMASYLNENFSLEWELPILHLFSLCCPSFLVEGKRQAGGSHLNERLERNLNEKIWHHSMLSVVKYTICISICLQCVYEVCQGQLMAYWPVEII